MLAVASERAVPGRPSPLTAAKMLVPTVGFSGLPSLRSRLSFSVLAKTVWRLFSFLTRGYPPTKPSQFGEDSARDFLVRMGHIDLHWTATGYNRSGIGRIDRVADARTRSAQHRRAQPKREIPTDDHLFVNPPSGELEQISSRETVKFSLRRLRAWVTRAARE